MDGVMDERTLSKLKSDLDENGWAVVESVLSPSDCEEYRQQFKDWADELRKSLGGKWPGMLRTKALIQGYRVGHLEATWNIRLKAKSVFASLWGTDKLLTSIDGVAIGPPPEDGETLFQDMNNPKEHWLHLDQAAYRKGLHAYQGGVSVEDADEDDWVLQVVEGSHKYHDEFWQFAGKEEAEYGNECEFYQLSHRQVEWYTSQGCTIKRIPVPKGGMVLWDSRTVHANSRPIEGRQHAGRWRFVTFVCMTPAKWASDEDIQDKKKAYNELLMTGHWCQKVVIFDETDEKVSVDCLPECAKTEGAKKLVGEIPYDFEDGDSNGPSAPQYCNESQSQCSLN